MKILDGRSLRDKKLIDLKVRVDRLKVQNIKPCMAFILVGNDPASEIYVNLKKKNCKKIGIISKDIKLPSSVSYKELEKIITELNNDDNVHGILVQFPLPPHLSKRRVSRLIDVWKDIDGIHPENQGIHFLNHKVYRPKPCTPYGIVELLNENNVKIKGKHVVIVGRSNIVGRPLSSLMNIQDGTVSLIHKSTPEHIKKSLFKSADILISATGVRGVINASDIKYGCVVVDVGIHRLMNGKIVGDLDFDEFKEKASYITPVPGGVGPMTITMLLENQVALIEYLRNVN